MCLLIFEGFEVNFLKHVLVPCLLLPLFFEVHASPHSALSAEPGTLFVLQTHAAHRLSLFSRVAGEEDRGCPSPLGVRGGGPGSSASSSTICWVFFGCCATSGCQLSFSLGSSRLIGAVEFPMFLSWCNAHFWGFVWKNQAHLQSGRHRSHRRIPGKLNCRFCKFSIMGCKYFTTLSRKPVS